MERSALGEACRGILGPRSRVSKRIRGSSASRGTVRARRRSAPQQQRRPYAGQANQPYAGATPQQPRAARAAQRPQYGQPAVQHPASGYGRNPYAQQNQGYAYSDDAQPVGSYGNSHETVYRVKKKRRSHRGRNIAIGIACAILVLVIAAGAGGYMLLQSARTVKADADQVMTLASGMMGKVEAGDMQGLRARCAPRPIPPCGRQRP